MAWTPLSRGAESIAVDRTTADFFRAMRYIFFSLQTRRKNAASTIKIAARRNVATAMCDTAILVGGFTRPVCFFWASFLTTHTRYFEWGAGLTTVLSDGLARRVVSVEGSKDWYQKMTTEHAFRPNTMLRYVDIGPTKRFSWPLNAFKGHAYVHAIDDQPLQDVVLVDGRFRVACALAAHNRLSVNGTVLVHDFERREYHVLLQFYNVRASCEKMVALTPKTNVSHSHVLKALLRFETDPYR